MTGIQIQYLLGLHFAILSVSFAGGRLNAEPIKLIAGIVLILLAISGFSPIR